MGIRSRLWRSKTDFFPPTLRHDLSHDSLRTRTIPEFLSLRHPTCSTNRYHQLRRHHPIPSLSLHDPGGFLALRTSIVSSRLLPQMYPLHSTSAILAIYLDNAVYPSFPHSPVIPRSRRYHPPSLCSISYISIVYTRIGRACCCCSLIYLFRCMSPV